MNWKDMKGSDGDLF